MDFVKKQDLLREGFKPHGRVLSDYLGLSGEGFYVLAKEVTPDTFEIHAASDRNGNRYDEIDLNGEAFSEIHGLGELLPLLKNPGQRRYGDNKV